ncbi:MAG: hypothetical protein O3B09_03810 [Proteobacteria bacterium]|nr:hypothetical protein [Pseudomonadota bacterium]
MGQFLELLGFKKIIIFISTGFSVIFILIAVGVIEVDDVVGLLGMCQDKIESDNSVAPDDLIKQANLEQIEGCPSEDILRSVVDNIQGATKSVFGFLDKTSSKLMDWVDGETVGQ